MYSCILACGYPTPGYSLPYSTPRMEHDWLCSHMVYKLNVHLNRCHHDFPINALRFTND